MTRWSNRPCTTCKTDTVHYAGKCRECGTIFVTPYEQRRKARTRHWFAMRFGKTPRGAFAAARKAIEAEQVLPDTHYNPSRGGRPVNGYGRERTKV